MPTVSGVNVLVMTRKMKSLQGRGRAVVLVVVVGVVVVVVVAAVVATIVVVAVVVVVVVVAVVVSDVDAVSFCQLQGKATT